MWYFSFAFIAGSIRKVWAFLVYEQGTSTFEGTTTMMATLGIATSEIIELFIYRYGAISIYLLISVIAVIIVLRESLAKKALLERMNFTYSIQFIVALAASAYSFWGFTGEGEPWRIIRFPLMMAPIVSGLVIYRLVSGDWRHHGKLNKLKLRGKVIISISTILILAVAALSIFSVYQSPRTGGGSWQVSRMQIAGTEWFGNHQDRDIITTTMGINLRRFEDFNFGKRTPSTKKANLDSEGIPSHFGYDGNSSIAETFNFRDRYLLTNELGRIARDAIPESIRYLAHQYTEEDFAKLGADSAVAQIYANGEFEVWRVYGK